MFSIQSNPLLIDTILRSLFTFVDYATLKECRQVCSKWKEFCDPEFIKRSAFVLNGKTPESFLHSPAEIPTLFTSINNSLANRKVLFSAFKFKHVQLTKILQEMYLEPNLGNLVQLEIITIRGFLNDDGRINYNADQLIGPNLIKFKLDNTWKPWTVSLEKLVPIHQIELYNCIILTNPETKMTPKVLTLVNCKLSNQVEGDNDNGDVDADTWELSEVIDFRGLKTLKLFHDCYSLETEVILNLGDCSTIKNLSLKGLTINMNGKISPEELSLEDNRYTINGVNISDILLRDYFNSSTQNIRKMTIKDSYAAGVKVFDLANIVPIDELKITGHTYFWGMNSENIIKKLKLSIPGDGSHFDLSAISQTIEYLELRSNNKFQITSFICSSPTTFPNLKRLLLSGCDGFFSYFQNCPSLEYIELINCPTATLNFDYLPPNIKGLALKNFYGVEIVGTKVAKLDVLLISDLSPQTLNLEQLTSFFQLQIADKIQAELVVFHRSETSCHNPKNSCPLEKSIKTIISLKDAMPGVNIVLGEFFCWKSHNVTHDSNLFSPVDKKSDFYLFECQNGKGISKLELSKVIPFDL